MARDDAFSRRQKRLREGSTPTKNHTAKKLADAPTTATTDAMIHRLDSLIEQVHQLYHSYFIGLEKRPPVELRKQLEQQMASLQNQSRLAAAVRFRIATLHSRYITHRDLWDRKLKDLENGKIKKTA